MTVAHLVSRPRSHLAQVIVPLRVFSSLSGRAWAVVMTTARAMATANSFAKRTIESLRHVRKWRYGPADPLGSPRGTRPQAGSSEVEYSRTPRRTQWAPGQNRLFLPCLASCRLSAGAPNDPAIMQSLIGKL